MTSTTSCAADVDENGGAISPLVTAVADALDDLGLKRLVVGGISTANQNDDDDDDDDEEQTYHRSVWRAYQQDRGGMSLTVARRLLGMALTAHEMQSMLQLLQSNAVVGRGGIMTWEDIEAVCRQMGCPMCCCTGTCTYASGTNVEQEGEDAIDEEVDDDAKAHRKLEFTLFLATEVECRRLSKTNSESKCESLSSPPPTKTLQAKATAKPNADVLQKLIEISPPGTELSDDQLISVLQQTTNATSQQIDRIVECNRALREDYSLRKKMMMQKFDATAIAMARSRRHVKSGSDQNKGRSEGMNAQGDGEEEEAEKEAAMDPVEMEIREIASGLANLELSAKDTNKAVDSGDGLLQQFLLPSTRFAPVTQTQIMKADVDTYDRGGRVDQDDRNSMPAWQKTRQDGPPPRTPPRTPGSGRSPSTEAPTSTPKNKKNKTPKKQPTPKQKEETKDEKIDSEVKISEGVEEVEKTKEVPGSTPKSARRRRGKGKSRGDTSRPSNATPDSTSNHGKSQDTAASEANTPSKSSKSLRVGSEHAKDAPETPAADSSAKNKNSKRRRPKKSNVEATPNNGSDQRSVTDKNEKRGADKKLESPKGQALKEDQADGKKKGSRRRRGRGKPGQKSNEAQEGGG